MFNNQMTPQEIIKAWQSQARSDLEAARSMRNHWQSEVERLERKIDSLDGS
ncbi:hypothetical protein [Sulfitobacter sp. R18_1]|uniref:hypothetical protein n=1 Tax=Sulfitobacter sp. R18_1 TaxID=2821104 RepID=UPI001ADA0756|nr:hypothetical protein [Sulfitobacter sp. R18_1]MBO9427999.1 hypothetical protein [Sulfitobacter sp. R18_1]